jgi:hypothetical protein
VQAAEDAERRQREEREEREREAQRKLETERRAAEQRQRTVRGPGQGGVLLCSWGGWVVLAGRAGQGRAGQAGRSRGRSRASESPREGTEAAYGCCAADEDDLARVLVATELGGVSGRGACEAGWDLQGTHWLLARGRRQSLYSQARAWNVFLGQHLHQPMP